MRVPMRSTARVVFGFGAVLFVLMVANALRIDALNDADLADQRFGAALSAFLATAALYVGIRLALGYPRLVITDGKLIAHRLLAPRKLSLDLGEYGPATVTVTHSHRWRTDHYGVALRHMQTGRVWHMPLYMFVGGRDAATGFAAELNDIRGLAPDVTDPKAELAVAQQFGWVYVAIILLAPLLMAFALFVSRK